MVKTLDVATQGAIRNRSAIVPVNFVTVFAKDRGTGAEAIRGFWNYPETVAVNVVDGETGMVVSRTFVGDGAITDIDPIPLTIGLEDRTISITMSQIHAGVQELVRGLDPRFAPVQVHRGNLDPSSGLLVAAPRIRFMGKINGTPINTPAAGAEGSIVLNIVSHTRELTRTNPAMKSDEQQRLRSGDRFRRYSTTAAKWPYWWGEEKSTGEGTKVKRKKIFGIF